MKACIDKISSIFSRLDVVYPFVPLLARLTIGWGFLWAGYGKLGNLGQVTGYFESLGIPFASVQAPFVSVVELLGYRVQRRDNVNTEKSISQSSG